MLFQRLDDSNALVMGIGQSVVQILPKKGINTGSLEERRSGGATVSATSTTHIYIGVTLSVSEGHIREVDH